MNKGCLLARLENQQWDEVVEVQQRVLSLLCILGEKLHISAIKLRPADNTLSVCANYQGLSCVMNFQTHSIDRSLNAWIEIYLMDTPVFAPDAFIQESNRCAIEYNVYTSSTMDGEGLVVGSTFYNIKTDYDLKTAFEHLVNHKHKLLTLFVREDREIPEGAKASETSIAVDGTDSIN